MCAYTGDNYEKKEMDFWVLTLILFDTVGYSCSFGGILDFWVKSFSVEVHRLKSINYTTFLLYFFTLVCVKTIVTNNTTLLL